MNVLKNTAREYSLLAKLIHWVSAVVVLGLFALGLWMMSLDYYDPWYQTGPNVHMGIGFLLVVVTVLRLAYRLLVRYPPPIPAPQWQMWVAKVIHLAFYLLIFLMFVTGYLIVTSKGEPLPIFNWFSLPAIATGFENLEDKMGDVHEWMAYLIIGLATVHALAALKHHFIDKDGTLKRMITRSRC